MQVTAETLPERTVALQVEVESERVNQTFEKVYRQLGKHVEVPGFRRGKAPISLLRQALREDYVRQLVLEQLLEDTMNNALKQAQVEPYGAPPEIDVLQLEEGKPLLYSLKVALEPTVEPGNYRGAKVTRYRAVVTEEDVQNQIESLRRQHARYERVNRAAQPDDVVFATLVPHVEGETHSRATRRNLFHLTEEVLQHPIGKMLLGMQAGDVKEETLVFPENDPDAELRGQTVHLQVTVHSVSEIKLPSLEELAQTLQLSSVEALHQQVQQQLQTELQQYAEEASKRSLQQAILQGAKVEISPIIVGAHARSELETLEEGLRRRGYTLEEYAQHYNMSVPELREYWYRRAERDITYTLLLRHIAQAEGITITEEERQQLAQQLAQQAGVSVDEVLQSERFQEELDSLLFDKTIQFLWSVADVTEEEIRIQSRTEQSDNEE